MHADHCFGVRAQSRRTGSERIRRCAEKILDKVALLRANGSKYNNMKFVGYTTLGNNWRGKCPQADSHPA